MKRIGPSGLLALVVVASACGGSAEHQNGGGGFAGTVGSGSQPSDGAGGVGSDSAVGGSAVGGGAGSGGSLVEACPPGTFGSENDATACVPWTVCQGWASFVAPGTATTDVTCASPFRLSPSDAYLAWAVAVTSLGDVVIAAQGENGTYLYTYDELGELTSVSAPEAPDGTVPQALALDAEENRYVGGYIPDAFEPDDDAFVRKYDALGTVQWTREFGGSGHEHIWSVAVDQQGVVYAVGDMDVDPEVPESTEAFVRTYDPAGTELSTQIFGAESYDLADDVAIAPSGNVYVVGGSNGDLAGSIGGFVRKFDAAGDVQWTRQVGDSQSLIGRAVAVDESEQIYVLYRQRDPIERALVRAYDALGSELWTTPVGRSSADSAEFDVAIDLTLDPSGGVYVAGHTAYADLSTDWGTDDARLRKYDASGNEQWVWRYDLGATDQVYAVAASATGAVYLAGSTTSSPTGPYPVAFALEGWPP